MTAVKRERDTPVEIDLDSRQTQRRKLTTAKKDPIFYRDDGDCVVKVEDVLFKIHKYHLLRGNRSKFQQILARTPGSETTPITLADDTCAQFRSFLSYAYEDPCISRTRLYTPADLRAIVDSGLFSDKYDIDPCKRLSIALIHQVCNAFSLHPLPPSLYTDILRLVRSQPIDIDAVAVFAVAGIRSAVQAAWSRGLSEQQTVAYIRQAMFVAAQYDCRELLGRAYNSYLIRAEQSAHRTRATTGQLQFVSAFPPNAMSDTLPVEHALRLLTGHWSLSQLWQQFSDAAPLYARGTVAPAMCTAAEHAEKCVVEWNEAWHVAVGSPRVSALAPSDVLNKLAALHIELTSTYARVGPRCGAPTAAIVPGLMAQVGATLADHFLGPPSPSVGVPAGRV
ncbi:hypothetical protein DFH06DRAFT_1302149 [Mycena polygramma]|nr:hypothetical protein DFH06DRAFT_1302149 [Mycena polygramma]